MKRAFVTGYPVRHSRSPMIHGYWLARHRLEGSYEAVEVAPEGFADFLASLKDGAAGFAGGNVTIPHKEQAYALADRADPLAEELGAANTLWVEDGALMATNTDGYGFLANLDDRAPGWDGTGDGVAVVFGAGGASRSVVQALRDRGFAEIHVVNRTIGRAEALADRFGPCVEAHSLEALGEVMQASDLFVNASSLGMKGTEAPPVDFTAMKAEGIIADLVYTPLVTPLLAIAERQGFRTVDGLGMLLHQAVPGFEKWFGVRPVVTAELRATIVGDLERPA